MSMDKPDKDNSTRSQNIITLLAILFFVSCCVYACYIHLTYHVLPYDDSFITYRYVKNFVEGNGLVYNPGHRIFGSSTPLYTAWLIILKTIFRSVEIPVLAVRGNVIFFLATGFGLLFLIRKYLGWTIPAALAASLFLLRYDMLAVSMGGIEAFLFCSLVVWSFYFLSTEKCLLAGTLAGLSIMARPEGVFCALLVGLVWLMYDRKKAVIFVPVTVTPGLIWTVFAFAYYGTPIYHSIVAKSRPLYPFPPWFALKYIHANLVSWSSYNAGKMFDVMAWMNPAIALAGLFLRRSSHRTTWFVIPGFFASILLFYAIGNPFVFDWYFPNILVGWFPLLMIGITLVNFEIFKLLWKQFGLGENALLPAVLSALIPLILLAGSAFLSWQGRSEQTLPAHFVRHHSQYRTLAYQEAADFINQSSDPTDTVSTAEVGALGYYLDRHVYDSCGLVTPEALPHLPLPYGRRVGPNIGSISAEFAEAVDADWLITMEIFSVESLYTSPWFKTNYVLAKRIPLLFEAFGSQEVLVYRHRQ